MCYKEVEELNITFWPRGQEIPLYCRRNPSLCGIETKTMNRCQTSINALDFVYDVEARDYVIHKYRTDQELVQKIQTGKGDTAFRYTELG